MAQIINIIYGIFNLETFETDVYTNRYDLNGTLQVQNLILAPYYITAIYNTPTTKFIPQIATALLAVQPESSPGSSYVDLSSDGSSAIALSDGFESDGQENIWWSSAKPNIIWGEHTTGSESSGTPSTRQGRSLVFWTKTDDSWALDSTIYPPVGTLEGDLYDYAVTIRTSLVDPTEIIVLAQPNTDQETHNSLAAAVYDYSTGALLRSAVIDSDQANSVLIGGSPLATCMSADGRYLVYFHYGTTEDYPTNVNLKRVQLSDLSVVTSQTPDEASAPTPWDGSVTPAPMLLHTAGVSAVSNNGQFVFMCFNAQAYTSPNAYPYLIWNTVANTISYHESMATISGFTADDYIPIPIPGGYMSVAWDENDKLWIVMERVDFGFDLIRFGLSGNTLIQEDIFLIDTQGTSPLGSGNSPSILMGTDDVDIDVVSCGVIEEPCEEESGPCGDDVETPCVATWPTELQARSIGIYPIKATLGGGPALPPGAENVSGTQNGFWRFALNDILITTHDQVRKWRQMEIMLEGHSNAICVSICEGKRAPWETVGDPIDAVANSNFAVGSVSGSIKVNSGGTLLPGMHFSTGERLYRLKTVGPPSGSPPVYPVTVWPIVRAAIAINDDLEFVNLTCKCRLRNPNGMSLDLDLLRYANASVEFEEDI